MIGHISGITFIRYADSQETERSNAFNLKQPPPPKIGKNMIFWCKIMIFLTKYPKGFRASLRSAQFFKVCPPP